MIKISIFIFFTSLGSNLFAQNIKGGGFALNTSIENFSGKYNIGGEYFFAKKEKPDQKDIVSLFMNIGSTNSNINGLPLTGKSIRTELRWYSSILLKDNWNEYLSLTADIGKFSLSNAPINSSFIGLSTGVQPKIAGNLHAFFQTDIGYYSNTTQKFGPLFNTNQANFSSVFGIGVYAGISFFLIQRK
ncbi:MAG: hypothetical protein EAZ35_06195 [Sphingobacteriia bacterium]|nr:MAG: hypothetical protein EAZ41_08435 [Sphingobacteriia bacterium]TAG30786.1 MAG: hypothetical protein EAZ35_06195 [Sphingobacteriia bacterium]